MPELRVDGVSGHTVLVAAERAARPHTAPATTAPAPPSDCPFCAGHEAMTPPEVHRTGGGEPDHPGWRVRVVPNLYPIVGGAHASGGATGAHEVIILSPDHRGSFGRLDADHAAEVLAVLRDRARVSAAAGHQAVQPFINHGRGAGASIAHPHAQLVALDILPELSLATVVRFDRAERDLVADERDTVEPVVVADDGSSVAWCPPAARMPYAMRVVHHARRARFEEAADDELQAVAFVLRDALARLEALLGDVPYNVVVRTAPPATSTEWFHWFLDVLPRTSVQAGFELGTGVDVNIVPPEQAATLLREAVAP